MHPLAIFNWGFGLPPDLIGCGVGRRRMANLGPKKSSGSLLRSSRTAVCRGLTIFWFEAFLSGAMRDGLCTSDDCTCSFSRLSCFDDGVEVRESPISPIAFELFCKNRKPALFLSPGFLCSSTTKWESLVFTLFGGEEVFSEHKVVGGTGGGVDIFCKYWIDISPLNTTQHDSVSDGSKSLAFVRLTEACLSYKTPCFIID